jgi:hypothetical protein
LPLEQSLDTVAVPWAGEEAIEHVIVSPASASETDGVREAATPAVVVTLLPAALGAWLGGLTVAFTVAVFESAPWLSVAL